MAVEKRINYLILEGFTEDVPVGTTTEELEKGDLVEIGGRVYVVSGDSGISRPYHEVYLRDHLEFKMKFYTENYPELSRRVAEFLADPSKFEVKKIR